MFQTIKYGQATQRGLSVKECSRCILNETLQSITFDDDGVCNYCHTHDALEIQYPIDPEALQKIADDIKKVGKGKPFDCVVGISGGKDSSYLLHLAKVELGLHPIAVHYDNGWDAPVAVRNIRRMTEALQVPLINYRVAQEEVDDLIMAFLFSHTQDAEAPTDLGLAKCILDAASHYGIKYILDGHSFRTEGMAPLGWSYMDGRYVQSVHDAVGEVPLQSYPLLSIMDQIWYGLKNIKRTRLLYYIDYQSEVVKDFLTSKYGWEWYGGHHLENTWTAFFDYYYRYNKLGYDGRLVELSALIRSGQITREEAIERMSMIQMPLEEEERIIDEVKQRLRIPDNVFRHLMSPSIKRTHLDWKTYKRHFKMLKPLFWLMSRAEMIPKTFYIKYCKE